MCVRRAFSILTVSSRYPAYRIRKATEEDTPVILKYITDLAVYEKEPPSVVKIRNEELLRDGFGDDKYYHALISEHVTANTTTTIGYGLYFFTYSTWDGRVLYIEDIYIEPKHRSKGLATLMMKECAKVAAHKDCYRMQWQVLDWNKEASKLYDRWGGHSLPEWVTYRMDRDTLLKHASPSDIDV